MKAIASFFLKAKHWQIFVLFFVFYVAATIAMLFDLVTARSQEELMGISLPFVFVMVLLMLCVVGWLWSMGSFLNSIAEPTLRLRVSFFRFALFYPTVYIPIFFGLSNATRPALLALIFPLHFFAMFCLFYDLYFVSKSLALVETEKPVSFYDYAGAFFLLWFFPVGVWFIQPRINRLHAERSSAGAITANVAEKS